VVLRRSRLKLSAFPKKALRWLSLNFIVMGLPLSTPAMMPAPSTAEVASFSAIRTPISIFVQNLIRRDAPVFAICLIGTAVGADTTLRSVSRCPEFLLGHSLSFLAGDSLYRSRLILHAPHDVVIVFSLAAHTLRTYHSRKAPLRRRCYNMPTNRCLVPPSNS